MATITPETSLGSMSSQHSIVSTQELVQREAIVGVPQCYVCQHLPPENSGNGDHYQPLPNIDMHKILHGDGPTDHEELEKLYSSCKQWGFFQVVNHGVRSRVMEKLRYEIGEFFKLPMEEKMKYGVRPGIVEGYGHYAISGREDEKRDWGDRFYFITSPLHRRRPHLLPLLSTSLRDTLEEYISELQKVGMTLLELLGRSVKMEKKEMDEMFENGMQAVRMTYYPPCPEPESVVGLTAHSDASGITILHQVNGVDGLQVKKDGNWVPVKFLPNAFVVNVGDILEILSNGEYSSVEHKVTVNSEKERISIAMFFNPKFEADICPAKNLINPNNPALFKRLRMEDYVKGFFSKKLNGKWFLEHMKIENGEEENAITI